MLLLNQSAMKNKLTWPAYEVQYLFTSQGRLSCLGCNRHCVLERAVILPAWRVSETFPTGLRSATCCQAVGVENFHFAMLSTGNSWRMFDMEGMIGVIETRWNTRLEKFKERAPQKLAKKTQAVHQGQVHPGNVILESADAVCQGKWKRLKFCVEGIENHEC